MLMPPCSSAPFCSGAREDVAGLPGVDADAGGVLVEQAVDDVQLGLAAAPAARGSCPAPSSAPAPLAHQWSGLMPQPMNRAANRFGDGRGTSPAVGGGAPDGDRLQPRQGHRHADARGGTSAATSAGGPVVPIGRGSSAHRGHSAAARTSTRLFRNCGLVTMVSTRLPKRSPLGGQPRAASASIVSSSDGSRLRPRA